MFIPNEFDISNRERRKAIYNDAKKTAEKLNRRIKNFYSDIDKNFSLTDGQKNEIKEKVLRNLNKTILKNN